MWSTEVAALPTSAPPTTTQVPHWNDLSPKIPCTSSNISLILSDQAAFITSPSGAAGMRQDESSLQVQEALRWLSIVIFDEGKRKALLELRDNKAQSMIDYLNALLSHPDLVDPQLRKHILIVLRKLCENSMLYPSCYSIDGIENISLIGAGGFCDIYQGRYQGQTLCLKVVRLYEKEDQVKMLKAHAREAILWNQLKHPNVTPFYGIFYLEELQKRISLLSPWMEHGNVVKYLKGNPQLPRKQFLYDIASGLEYLHNANIVHGDLKGANVLVDGSSTARISDFGLSKILTDATLGSFDTSDAMAGLTPNWASPELLEEYARPTRESDIWAFGCVCYEVLTGLFPFHGCNGPQVVRKMIDRKLPAQPVKDRLDQDTTVNKKIWSLVKRCWSYETARRPGCSEILQEMKRDALVWQIRAEVPNCEGQSTPRLPRIGNPTLGLNQARWFLEILGTGMDNEESGIANDRLLSSNRVSFLDQCFATFSRSPAIKDSQLTLPNLPPADTRDVMGAPSSASLYAPAVIYPLTRPSLSSRATLSMDDQQEDRREIEGAESPIADNNHPCGLSSFLQFLCCCRKYSSTPQPSDTGLIVIGQSMQARAHGSFIDLPQLSLASRNEGFELETILRYEQSSWNGEGSIYSIRPCMLGSPSNLSFNSGIFIDLDDNRFMENLLRSTLVGAEFDSSARYPAPRCHPDTRLDVIKRCLDFIANCSGAKRVRWVFGAAGVGKSAIMRSVAESPGLEVSSHASVFLSVDGRSDAAKVIVTLCYQLAAKSHNYRHFIEREVTRDPSLLHSSMLRQFNKFVVEPFTTYSELYSFGRTLVIIDGLDECEDRTMQLELLHLITEFCIEYPHSPVVWLIASRPEEHITSFFSTPTVQQAYEREEIVVDSDNSFQDVKSFLHHELQEIKERHFSSPPPEWPNKRDFLILTNASDGLFAYARAVIEHIGYSISRGPVQGLDDVLRAIKGDLSYGMLGEENPMAPLDALYARILSNVPPQALENTQKFLLALAVEWDWFLYPGESNCIVLCNWLAISAHDAYIALSPLFSVLRVPLKCEANSGRLNVFHKSFIDYISNYSRSRLFADIQLQARQLKSQCTQRILNEAPDGIDFGSMDYESFFGDLACGPGTGEEISLTWLADEKDKWNDNETRLNMYKTAIGWMIHGIKTGESNFQDQFYIRLLTTRFKRYGYFPYDEFSDLVFDKSRRDEFTRDGLLKQVSLEAMNFSTSDKYIRLRFRCPPTAVVAISDAWNSTCTHERRGRWEKGDYHDWTTNIPKGCTSCWERFKQQLASWKSQTPSLTIPILFSSTGQCCVEFEFGDPEVDSSSGPVWTYRLWFELSLEERKKYGATV